MQTFAHRGLPQLYPEHTLSSLKAALKESPDYVEPDVVLTKDDVFLVLHDIHLDATTNVNDVFPGRHRSDGRFYAVDFSLSEIRMLKFNHRINVKTGKPAILSRKPSNQYSESALTFKEFIDEVLSYNTINGTYIGIYPELKDPEFHYSQGKKALSHFADILNKVKFKNPKLPIIAQCFHGESLKHLRFMLRKDIKTVQLIGDNSWKISSTDYKDLTTVEGLREVSTYSSGIGIWIGHLDLKNNDSDPLIMKAKKIGLEVHAYTVRNDLLPEQVKSEKELISILEQKKVDGVFTDNVSTTVKIVKKLKLAE